MLHSVWCPALLCSLREKKAYSVLFLIVFFKSFVWHHLCFASLLISPRGSIMKAEATQSSLKALSAVKVRNCWSCFQLLSLACSPACVFYPFAFWIFVLSCFLLGHDFIAQSQLPHSAGAILQLCCLLDCVSRAWKMLGFAVTCCSVGLNIFCSFVAAKQTRKLLWAEGKSDPFSA